MLLELIGGIFIFSDLWNTLLQIDNEPEQMQIPGARSMQNASLSVQIFVLACSFLFRLIDDFLKSNPTKSCLRRRKMTTTNNWIKNKFLLLLLIFRICCKKLDVLNLFDDSLIFIYTFIVQFQNTFTVKTTEDEWRSKFFNIYFLIRLNIHGAKSIKTQSKSKS